MLFDDAIYYIQIAVAIPAAWATLCLALQATTTHPRSNRRSVRNPPPHHLLPPRHYPILALAACCLGRAVVGAACHDAVGAGAGGAGRFRFWYLLFDVGAQLAMVWAAAGGARLVRGRGVVFDCTLPPPTLHAYIYIFICFNSINPTTGRKPHLLALAATTALAVVLAGVAAHMANKNSSSSNTCTPIQSAALDGLLAPFSGVCALVALLALFVYPAWRERRGGQRPDRATLPSSGALEPLLEGGGAAGADQQQQERPQQGIGPLPSRRLKLLVAFSALTMLLGCGRCLLRLTRYVSVCLLTRVGMRGEHL